MFISSSGMCVCYKENFNWSVLFLTRHQNLKWIGWIEGAFCVKFTFFVSENKNDRFLSGVHEFLFRCSYIFFLVLLLILLAICITLCTLPTDYRKCKPKYFRRIPFVSLSFVFPLKLNSLCVWVCAFKKKKRKRWKIQITRKQTNCCTFYWIDGTIEFNCWPLTSIQSGGQHTHRHTFCKKKCILLNACTLTHNDI